MTLCNWCGKLLNFTEKYSCLECKKNQVKMCLCCKRPFNDIKYFANPQDSFCSSCKIKKSNQEKSRNKEKHMIKNVYNFLKSEDKKNFILSKPEKGKKQTLITNFLSSSKSNSSLVSKISNSQVKPVKQPRKMSTGKDQTEKLAATLKKYQVEIAKKN